MIETPCPSRAPRTRRSARRFDIAAGGTLTELERSKARRSGDIRRFRSREQLRVSEERAEEDARVEDTVAAADNCLSGAEDVESEAETRTEVVVVLIQERARLAVDTREYRRSRSASCPVSALSDRS